MQRSWLARLREQGVETGGNGVIPRGIVEIGVGVVDVTMEPGVAPLEVADARQAATIDADSGRPAARRIGDHVTAEQAEHGADLVVVEFLGKIIAIEAAEAFATPDEI